MQDRKLTYYDAASCKDLLLYGLDLYGTESRHICAPSFRSIYRVQKTNPGLVSYWNHLHQEDNLGSIVTYLHSCFPTKAVCKLGSLWIDM